MKQYNRVPYSFFEETLKKLDKNPGELCEALGYGSHAYRLWKKTEEMPAVAALACKALLKEQALQSYALLVVAPSRESLETIRKLAIALEAQVSEVL